MNRIETLVVHRVRITPLEKALRSVATEQWAKHGAAHVHEWYLGEFSDHIYRTCPALRRSMRGAEPRRGRDVLYPDAGDVCGWCARVWRARRSA